MFAAVGKRAENRKRFTGPIVSVFPEKRRENRTTRIRSGNRLPTGVNAYLNSQFRPPVTDKRSRRQPSLVVRSARDYIYVRRALDGRFRVVHLNFVRPNETTGFLFGVPGWWWWWPCWRRGGEKLENTTGSYIRATNSVTFITVTKPHTRLRFLRYREKYAITTILPVQG